MSEKWEEGLSPAEKKFKVFFEDWMNRPLKALVESAVQADGGIAFDALSANGVRKGIVICVVPKNKALRDITAQHMEHVRRFTSADLETMNLYTLIEPCFSHPLTIIGVLENPVSIIYAALERAQIDTLVELFNIDASVPDICATQFLPPSEFLKP